MGIHTEKDRRFDSQKNEDWTSSQFRFRTIGDIGVNIQQFGFIGSPRPPKQVIEAINNAQQAKYLAVQKQNELQQINADVAKQIAQAEGQAKANSIVSSSITPQLLEKQKLDIQDRWIGRWNGQRPQTEISPNAGTGFLIEPK